MHHETELQRVDYEIQVWEMAGTRSTDEATAVQRLDVTIVPRDSGFVPRVGVPLALRGDDGAEIVIEFDGAGYIARHLAAAEPD
jgi:hypothetical protein